VSPVLVGFGTVVCLALIISCSILIVIVMIISTFAVFHEEKHKGRSGDMLMTDIWNEEVIRMLFQGSRTDHRTLHYAIREESILFARELKPNVVIETEQDARLIISLFEPWQDEMVKRAFLRIVKHVICKGLECNLLKLDSTGDTIQCWPKFHRNMSQLDNVVTFFTRLLASEVVEETTGNDQEAPVSARPTTVKSKSTTSLFNLNDSTLETIGLEMQEVGVNAADAKDVLNTLSADTERGNKAVSARRVKKMLKRSATQSSFHGLEAISEGQKRSISQKRLEYKLSSILHSHFSFCRRGRFLQKLRGCGLAYGCWYYRWLVGSPRASSLAAIDDLAIFGGCETPDGTDQELYGSTHFTALWLDTKSDDEGFMLFLGFLQIIQQLLKRSKESDNSDHFAVSDIALEIANLPEAPAVADSDGETDSSSDDGRGALRTNQGRSDSLAAAMVDDLETLQNSDAFRIGN
jgi:hypothetical protein